MNSPAFELTNVSRCFDDGLVRALDGVNVAARQGERLAIVGPSGSGKSTLLNLIGALDFASQGEVRVLGERIHRGRRLDRFRNTAIGFVFQLHNLLPHLTLEENVMLPLRPAAIPEKEARLRAAALLQRVGLAERGAFLPVKVSSGERQRAAVARALAANPRLILADEPTGSLDSKSAATVMDLLLEVAAADGRTLAVVTHDQTIAARLERVIELRDGRIVRA